MKFTKGEWKVGSFQDEPQARSVTTVYSGDSKVAEVCKTGFQDIQERQANAHLISAAPDMYEALRHASIVLYNLKVSNLGELTQQQELLRLEIDRILNKTEGK